MKCEILIWGRKRMAKTEYKSIRLFKSDFGSLWYINPITPLILDSSLRLLYQNRK